LLYSTVTKHIPVIPIKHNNIWKYLLRNTNSFIIYCRFSSHGTNCTVITMMWVLFELECRFSEGATSNLLLGILFLQNYKFKFSQYFYRESFVSLQLQGLQYINYNGSERNSNKSS
jgi:hypothetical protein